MVYNNQKVKVINEVKKFGDSIHYCDLTLNKTNINDYFTSVSENIFGVSMPFITQKKPGPISNDIVRKICSINL